MRNTEADKSHVKRKLSVKKGSRLAKPAKSGNSLRNRERRLTLQDCPNFSRGRASSFVFGYDDIVVRVCGQAHTRTFQPSVVVIANLYTERVKRVNFQPVSIAVGLPEVTFEPISIAGWGCSSVGRASERHAAEAGSIPRCGKGFFLLESTFTAVSLPVSVHPRGQSPVLTSVLIDSFFSSSVVHW